jgi:hypothetical protein
MSRISGFIIVAGLITARPAVAQSRAELESRVAAARARLTQANVAVSEFNARRRVVRTATDTATIANGAITIISDRTLAPLVKPAIARADAALRNVDGLIPRLAGSEYRLRQSDSDSLVDADESHRKEKPQVLFAIRRAKTRFDADAATMPMESVAIAHEMVVQTVNRLADGNMPFAAWHLGGLPYDSADVSLPIDWGAVRFSLLDSKANVGPKCYRGDLLACSMALGLTRADDPVMAWYDSLTRIQTVRDNRGAAISANAEATKQCLNGVDRACGDALRAINRLTRPTAGALATQSLLTIAVRMGGPRAVERILSSAGTPSDAIAAGAGVPIDSVLRVWQKNVHDEAIGSETLTVGMVLTALFWIAVLLVLATRISRWR